MAGDTSPLDTVRTVGWAIAGVGATLHPLLAVAGWAVVLPGRARRPVRPVVLPFAGVVGVAATSAVVAGDRLAGLTGAAAVLAVFAAMAWSYGRLDASGRAALLWGLFAGGLANVVVGVAQALQGTPQPTGFSFHPNIYVAHLGLAIAAGLALAAGARSRLVRVATASAAGALVVAAVASGSRGGLVGLVVGAAACLVVWSWRSSRRRLWLAVAATLLVPAALVASGAVAAVVASDGERVAARADAAGPAWTRRLPSRLQELATDPVAASGGRLSMWVFGVQLAARRPVLGHGFGAEERLVRTEAARFVLDPLRHLHSSYLTLLVEGGASFLAAVLLWLGAVLRALARLALRGSNAALAVAGLLAALMTMSAFDQVLSHVYVLVATWWLAAAVLTEVDDAER